MSPTDNSRVGADWEPGPVVAWTESDGPGRLPPVAPRRLGIAGAIAAGIAASAMMTADTVCPEHSLFIEIAGLLTIVLTIIGVVAALRSSVLAPPLVLAASVIEFSIGFVDVLHDPVLSRIIAVAFGVGAIVTAFSAASSVRRLWSYSTRV